MPMNHLQIRREHRLDALQLLANQLGEILLVDAYSTPTQLLCLNETNGLSTLRSEERASAK